MKKQKSIGNKGFSLVELIIVIAIMAILVGVMAPQLLRYIERTRVSSDVQVADSVRTAVVTAILDPSVDNAPATGTYTLAEIYNVGGNFTDAVSTTLNDQTAAQVEGQLKSRAHQGQTINVEITSGMQVIVRVGVNSGETGDPIEVPEQSTTGGGAGGGEESGS